MNKISGYDKLERFDPERTEQLMTHYRAIIRLLGETPTGKAF